MIGTEIDDAIRDLESQGFEFVSYVMKQKKPYIATFSRQNFLKNFNAYDRYLVPDHIVRVFDKVKNLDQCKVASVFASYECLLVKENDNHY